MKKTTELKVFISAGEPLCNDCGEDLGRGAWIVPMGDRRALCLACADLDHLIFLPAGDAALTRRSRKYSTLAAVVLRWSRARNRFERQGLLVEEAALEKAEDECLADREVRARRRERDAERRAELDREYVKRFADRVREFYPLCPSGRESIIAEHACLKYSGRIGRSAAAKSLDAEAVDLAVIAHVRHAETKYDELLALGWDRSEARRNVEEDVDRIIMSWAPPE